MKKDGDCTSPTDNDEEEIDVGDKISDVAKNGTPNTEMKTGI